MFYRLTWDVMQLKKPSNIKNKPNKTQKNQTKQVKITKTKNIDVCTNNHTAYDSYAIVNSLIRINNFAGVQITHQSRSFCMYMYFNCIIR